MSSNVVALLILLGLAGAAVLFTLVIVVVVDRSVARTQQRSGSERGYKEKRDPGPR